MPGAASNLMVGPNPLGEKRSIHGTGMLPLGSENNQFLGARASTDINIGSLRQAEALSASAYSALSTNPGVAQAQNSHIIMNNNAMFLLGKSFVPDLYSVNTSRF